MREEQFAPALPVIPYDDIDEAVARGQRHRRSACAPRCGATTRRWPPTWPRRLSAGTVFVNAHGISAIDMYAPMGGWKQSGFGVELGTEGMQAFARQRVRVRRPGPGEQGAGVHDVAIRGGTVVDGTGAPPVRADVAHRGRAGRRHRPRRRRRGPTRCIDATGMLVAPGFVDLHTHYDAQLFWDPNASPSPLHGVTTVLGGNCGFSLAPLAPEHADYIARMMARVEGMPLAALRAGPALGLELLRGVAGPPRRPHRGQRRLPRRALDAAPAGHGRARRRRRRPPPADLDAMEAALHAALAEGALGFSTSQVHTHNDGDGQPVPSRAAGRAEMERLAAAVRAHEGTTVELIVAGLPQRLHRRGDRLPRHHVAAGRPPGQLERARASRP